MCAVDKSGKQLSGKNGLPVHPKANRTSCRVQVGASVATSAATFVFLDPIMKAPKVAAQSTAQTVATQSIADSMAG